MVPDAPETPHKDRPKRLQWWYSHIADWMISHPGGTMKQCAADLGKHYTTILLITGSDVFKEYYNQRRAAFERDHDFTIRSKLTAVAEASLDVLLATIEEKKKAIPLGLQNTIVTSALDRLGYSPQAQAPSPVQVNVTNAPQQIVAAVTVSELEAARAVMRAAEEKRRTTPSTYVPPVIEGAAEQLPGDEEGSPSSDSRTLTSE